MATPQAHYENLLGSVYTWMAGGFEAGVTRGREQFHALGLADWPRGLAVDLGCGSGFQSIPLAEAGYRVIGLDLCASLLRELRAHAGSMPIQTFHDNLAHFAHYLDAAPVLMVCMGDTLTHLSSVEAVASLIRASARALAPGGHLVLGFRDLASHELKGAQRFIPVRQEADRLFTCFLDYHESFVEVNDLLQERVDGQWRFSAGAYRKLRLHATQVAGLVTGANLILEQSFAEQGLVRIVARRAE